MSPSLGSGSAWGLSRNEDAFPTDPAQLQGPRPAIVRALLRLVLHEHEEKILRMFTAGPGL